MTLLETASYSGACRALSEALADRDWFETGAVLSRFEGPEGRPMAAEEVFHLMLACGQNRLPSRERVRQSRAVYRHFRRYGLSHTDARGLPLDTARVLCQHHRRGRLDEREFRRAAGALKHLSPSAAGVSARHFRATSGVRDFLDLV